jgi:DNA-binding MarR family transcriptional regulator
MRPDSRDARRREVRITPKGRRALARARELWLRAQDDTRAALGEERSRELLALLAAVA